MTWFVVDDKFGESTKVKRIPRGQRMAAIGLWTLAGQWSAGQLADGTVPTYMVEELGGSERLAAALVACGLWEKTQEGYVFHDWADWQQTRAQVEKKRSDARERMARLRGGSGEVRANSSVTSPEVRNEFATPFPSLPIPTKEESGPRKRGTRITEDWIPSAEVRAEMQQERPDVDLKSENAKFIDHWMSQPGSKGVKLDWDRTWRNWIRNARGSGLRVVGGGRKLDALGFVIE